MGQADRDALKLSFNRRLKLGFHGTKAAGAFCWIAVIWGVCFAVLTPPFQVADETKHFWRAFQISDGYFLGEKQDGRAGGFMPRSVVQCGNSTSDMVRDIDRKQNIKDTLDLFKLPLNKHDRVFTRFSFGKYSFVPYLPQSVAIGLARISHNGIEKSSLLWYNFFTKKELKQ